MGHALLRIHGSKRRSSFRLTDWHAPILDKTQQKTSADRDFGNRIRIDLLPAAAMASNAYNDRIAGLPFRIEARRARHGVCWWILLITEHRTDRTMACTQAAVAWWVTN